MKTVTTKGRRERTITKKKICTSAILFMEHAQMLESWNVRQKEHNLSHHMDAGTTNQFAAQFVFKSRCISKVTSETLSIHLKPVPEDRNNRCERSLKVMLWSELI